MDHVYLGRGGKLALRARQICSEIQHMPKCSEVHRCSPRFLPIFWVLGRATGVGAGLDAYGRHWAWAGCRTPVRQLSRRIVDGPRLSSTTIARTVAVFRSLSAN